MPKYDDAYAKIHPSDAYASTLNGKLILNFFEDLPVAPDYMSQNISIDTSMLTGPLNLHNAMVEKDPSNIYIERHIFSTVVLSPSMAISIAILMIDQSINNSGLQFDKKKITEDINRILTK